MSISTTIDKLVEMRMTTMSEMFRNQLKDPKMKDVPFEERFAMLVDAEHASRKSHAFERLVKKAELEQSDAGIATIDYHSGRKLNKSLIQKLADCEYISQCRNIFITGATGSGKTYCPAQVELGHLGLS